jgi:hypothetical protein
MACLTNGLHRDVNAWAHDFVPPIHGRDQPSRVAPAARAAEGVYERGIGCKVCLDSLALDGWRRLSEEVDNSGDLLYCWEGYSQCWELRMDGKCELPGSSIADVSMKKCTSSRNEDPL